MLLQKIIDEIKKISQAQQEELYQLIQEFRHHVDDEPSAEPYDSLEALGVDDDQPRTPGLLQGKLSDTFFEPLPESELHQWETAT